MNAHPHLSRSDVVTMTIAAALSAFIAIGGLSALAGFFLRDGTPYEQVLATERACAKDAPVSKACPRPDATGTPVSRVASR